MSNPERIQISVNSVFQMFSQQDEEILTQCDVIRLLNFAFVQLGITRPVQQFQIDNFYAQFGIQNKTHITKQDLIQHQFLAFNHPSVFSPQITCIKIPIQPFVAQMAALGQQIIDRNHIRQFLCSVNQLLQIPKPVEDNQVSKFIADFDRNNDGVLERQDLENIDCLKFMVRKCRRYE